MSILPQDFAFLRSLLGGPHILGSGYLFWDCQSIQMLVGIKTTGGALWIGLGIMKDRVYGEDEGQIQR